MSFLGVQREGLDAILDLSSDAIGPVESSAAERLRAALSAAEKSIRDRLAEIAERTSKGIENAEQDLAARRAEIDAKYQSAVTMLKDKTRADRDRLVRNTREFEAKLNQHMQEAFLVADTVAQANCDRLRKQRRALERQAEAEQKKFEELKSNAEWILAGASVPLPGELPPPPSQAAADDDSGSSYKRHLETAEARLEDLAQAAERLRRSSSRAFVLAAIVALLLTAVLVGLVGFKVSNAPPLAISIPAVVIVAAVLAAAASRELKRRHRVRLAAAFAPIAAELAAGRREFDQFTASTRTQHARAEARAAEIRRENPEKITLKQRLDAQLAESRQRLATSVAELESGLRRQQAELEKARDAALVAADARYREKCDTLRRESDQDTAAAHEKHRSHVSAAQSEFAAGRAEIDARWQSGLARIDRLLHASALIRPEPSSPWKPRVDAAGNFTALIPFGCWKLNVPGLAVDNGQTEPRPVRENSSPIVLSVPDHSSLLLQTDRAGRSQAVDVLRVIMLRLLTTLPPGRVRFTIIDPLGLGESFAGFMHLVDYEEALVGGRIWTDTDQIEARLTELTSHMENVIQKYLRNEFATIDAYNRHAGQLAEPYRFLVVADFPANFNENAIRRISSIINSGPRCGVFTLILHDTRLKLPPELPLSDLAAGRLHLVHNGESFVAQDSTLGRFQLQLDTPPAEDELTRLMHEVGRRAKNAFHVELPFDAIVPPPDQRWSRSAANDVVIPIGHAGAVRLQQFNMGRGLAQHALIAGKTGSGKSTLLHVIVTNIALWYRPDEVELYLIDFKKGVEFKTYVTHALPHARAIAIESDREFGVSVLQRLDAEMTRRGDLFRAVGVQDLPAYREAARKPLPRTILVVDEFQVFFAEDDRLSQEAAVLLDRLVRQGRAFGIHVVLGSQTLAGTAGLARSTMGQMAIRIALQCSEADSQLILDDTNVAARLLARPGEAIYNDAGGLVAGNSNFQVAWLADERQAELLDEIRASANQANWSGPPPIVFEGNALADIRQNRSLGELIDAPAWPSAMPAPRIWLGEPVAIKEPTHLTLRQQSAAHALLIGQRDDVAQTLLASAVLCLAAQHAPASAKFIVLPGAAGESPGGELHAVVNSLPHDARWVDWRDVPAVMADLAGESKRRLERGPADDSRIFVIINGLQRYRALRRQEDVFSISSSDADAPPAVDRQFAELLREGPPLGLHVIAWADTYATLERTLERQSIREFDNRVLFQMSATDSSNLIDSPEANRLGFHRAFFFSEERGLLEKFRPYAPLDPEWLRQVQVRLAAKPR